MSMKEIEHLDGISSFYEKGDYMDELMIEREIEIIKRLINKFKIRHVWIEPNGDPYSNLLTPYINQKNLPRKKFLGLIKNCKYFITNSSCQYYEAPFLMNKKNIISIGKRNIERESKHADMTITGATDRIIKILENLNG